MKLDFVRPIDWGVDEQHDSVEAARTAEVRIRQSVDLRTAALPRIRLDDPREEFCAGQKVVVIGRGDPPVSR